MNLGIIYVPCSADISRKLLMVVSAGIHLRNESFNFFHLLESSALDIRYFIFTESSDVLFKMANCFI